MRERGSALLTSVVAVMVLLLISGVFFTLVNHQAKIESTEEKGLKAYYLAQAGVNYGVAVVLKNMDDELEQPVPNGQTETKSNPFQAADPSYGGQFEVKWTLEADGKSFTVQSTGTYPLGSAGATSRTIAAYYRFEETTGDGDGDDDDGGVPDDEEEGPANTTVGVSEVLPEDKQHVNPEVNNFALNESFTIYFYVLDNPDNLSQSKKLLNPTITIIDAKTEETIISPVVTPITFTVDKKEYEGYRIEASYDKDVFARVRVAGTINIGGGGENGTVVAYSDCFKIGNPAGECSGTSSGSGLIWIKEEVINP